MFLDSRAPATAETHSNNRITETNPIRRQDENYKQTKQKAVNTVGRVGSEASLQRSQNEHTSTY